MIWSVVILGFSIEEKLDELAGIKKCVDTPNPLYGVVLGIIGLLLMRTYYKPQTINTNRNKTIQQITGKCNTPTDTMAILEII